MLNFPFGLLSITFATALKKNIFSKTQIAAEITWKTKLWHMKKILTNSKQQDSEKNQLARKLFLA